MFLRDLIIDLKLEKLGHAPAGAVTLDRLRKASEYLSEIEACIEWVEVKY